MRKHLVNFFVFILFSISTLVHASTPADNLKQEWATAKYETPKKEKLQQLEKLILRGDNLISQYNDSAELYLWQGTILSTFASVKGGVGALKSTKKAKAMLEKSIAINPDAENGQAHAILGALYTLVPSWPVAFGNKEKAKTHLLTAIKKNPHNIDAHFYYATLLKETGNNSEAKRVLQEALKIPPNPEFIKGYNGRREEVKSMLQSL